jgi:peptidoglycan hydrolase-like protein with peptidoglycan-binding domain
VAFGGGVAVSDATQAGTSTKEQRAPTMPVERGALDSMVSLDGVLTYRAQPDGSPYSVINHAAGTYTRLPAAGDRVACGDELYRVDDKPVLLLCGTVPTYRSLRVGDSGNDVQQLNANLHMLGVDSAAGVELSPDDNDFTWRTAKALEVLQYDKGLGASGVLAIDNAVVLPESARIAKVAVELGGLAQSGVSVLSATSDALEVQVQLDASQQGEVRNGDHAQITLPGNKSVPGMVDRLGTVAQVPAGQNANAGPAAATISAYVSVDDPAAARGLDQAPVQVDITTQGVDNVLSVPVTAIVGRSGGGYAVEIERVSGRRELVAVKLGLFDTTAGRVQVDGHLRRGDQVVVPSS